MSNWTTLLARHGFEKADLDQAKVGHNTNTMFLNQALTLAGCHDLDQEPVTERAWIQALEQAAEHTQGRGRETIVYPVKEELPLQDIDPYMRGIVRWLNELGIYTVYSCDGHDRGCAYVRLKKCLSFQQMSTIKACLPQGLKVRFEGKRVSFFYQQGEISKLLDMGERLYQVKQSEEKVLYFEAEQFKQRVIELLKHGGSSGNEREIRQFLQRKLRKLTDYTYVDHAGNLLAYLYCGEGPTVLISAHMDIYEDIKPGRTIIENGTQLFSSEGILGADDRAGIAVILEVLSRIQRTNFAGTFKIAFTVKEETGCIGSKQIDPHFIEDADAAIVADRRGTRDIVISYGGMIPFCPQSYGHLFEQADALCGMYDWRMTAGGLSDAKVFAEKGIPSVNLSVGYMNEHSKEETLDYRAAYETAKLIESVLHHNLIKGAFDRELHNSVYSLS
ncbi:hypothetical protein J2S00_000191 [Caldalkalibacillus uzonensis]|uniref:M20/M25/M40 family metallo-hydrolase n=1 Tax=Caldalkalibacillus uzonensis TaxID=353224 RepID=A0ABU0CLX3_9BACI|nr:M20/M25/M40 family metallo-hydrolase [Caldalkalibacillus uzonensis]MDQ0337421.1 hypothetical protein [Caldalkalibacillus uzonensis]